MALQIWQHTMLLAFLLDSSGEIIVFPVSLCCHGNTYQGKLYKSVPDPVPH